jgi:hypothetical protein
LGTLFFDHPPSSEPEAWFDGDLGLRLIRLGTANRARLFVKPSATYGVTHTGAARIERRRAKARRKRKAAHDVDADPEAPPPKRHHSTEELAPRLKLSCGFSDMIRADDVARSLGVARATVAMARCNTAGATLEHELNSLKNEYATFKRRYGDPSVLRATLDIRDSIACRLRLLHVNSILNMVFRATQSRL